MSTIVATDPDLDAYRETLAIGLLAPRPTPELRRALLAVFREKPNWRVAQHLTLAWLNKLGKEDFPPDLVRAAYFAWKACELSNDDPRAVMVRAMVNWERRLSTLVVQETAAAEERARAEIEDTAQAHIVVRELRNLRACGLAYNGHIQLALTLLAEGEGEFGAPSFEAALQLFIAAMGDTGSEHQCSRWLLNHTRKLGERPKRRLEATVRSALLRVLQQRGESDA